MTYELAKKLKDAGFPQELERRIHYRENCEECMNGNYEKPMSLELLDELDIAIPTLSELIEACGNKFRRLTLHSKNKKHPNLIWQASPNQHNSLNWKQGVRGDTPEEAVAELWLKFNKK
jgi:hypothetical protein